MEVVHNSRKLKLNKNNRIYECSICENLFNWGPNSRWYGSYADQENNPEKIVYICSEACKDKFKENTPDKV